MDDSTDQWSREHRTRRWAHGCVLGLSAHGKLSPVVLSVSLILAGLLLFLVNLGWLPIHNVWACWPVAFIVFGIARAMESRSASSHIWSVGAIFFGALFLCINMGWLHMRTSDDSWMLAIVFVVIGLGALTKAVEPRTATQVPRATPRPDPPHQGIPFDPDFLNDSAILGSVQRRVETNDFKGGVITSVLGTIELDLRRACIHQPERPINLEVVAVLGTVKLRIPESWRLTIIGTPVLGSYEDKTIPQARVEALNGRLLVSGSCVLGSVEIEN
ncbi:MAG: hypothetical protein JO061_06290 [Acidobacteriaceae bacterium]|nr:hypothetical protein [Acidobacteriaceae bacterium]